MSTPIIHLQLSNVYRDAQMQGMDNPMISDLKRDFENGMRVQLAMKVSVFLFSSFLFASLQCNLGGD